MLNRFSLLILLAAAAGCRKDAPAGSGTVPAPATDSFQVTVNQGYGSGRYKPGDTVHIFSLAYPDNQIFGSWAGPDTSLLNAPREWHTWFIMPARDLRFTASTQPVSTFTLQYSQIMGRDRVKPVYYYFPAGHRGFVYLLHGTGGTARSVVNSYEFQLLIRDLVHDGLGVVITEAEEATTGVDANGDGKLRWATTPFDSLTNVDYANIRILTDSLIRRGLTDAGKPRYSIGMSNGGNFSATLSELYHFPAAVSYCAPAGGPVAQTTTTPLQFCMARFDNNPNVGPAGNAMALDNSQTLTARNICSRYLVKEHAPLYPERFARSGQLTLSQSAAVFNELKAKGYLDARNYFIGYSQDLTTAYQADPSSFPVLSSLNPLLQYYVTTEIDLSVSDHQMYSDYNRATLRFLDGPCQ
ncbi:MAG TPA: hypothetical protein VG870_13120 [Chitinophagaceae bacterium]|nr:hypothetical protein [Chitinophagaceae bacterium]